VVTLLIVFLLKVLKKSDRGRGGVDRLGDDLLARGVLLVVVEPASAVEAVLRGWS